MAEVVEMESNNVACTSTYLFICKIEQEREHSSPEWGYVIWLTHLGWVGSGYDESQLGVSDEMIRQNFSRHLNFYTATHIY